MVHSSYSSHRHPRPHGATENLGTSDGGRDFVHYLNDVRPAIEAAILGASDPAAAVGAAGGAGQVGVTASGHARLREPFGGGVGVRGVASGEDFDDASSTMGDLRRYLFDPLRDFVCAGGKRVRPALCLLGAEAVGGVASDALSAAVAVELFQTAALAHDDIADNGEMRRGKPCLHVCEGVGIAVNVGDRALMDMYGIVLGDDALPVATRHAVLRELQSMAERTAEGQALDIGWARDGRWDITVGDYLSMATCKTAHYSAASPLVCGALCGGATKSQIDALRSFGLAAGLAFQLQDDLLNVVGDASAQGKDFRSDITEGKRTMLVAHALAHLDDAAAAQLVSLLSAGTTDAADLARAVELMESAGSVAYVRAYASALVADATAALATADVTPRVAALLSSMADFFVSRTA